MKTTTRIHIILFALLLMAQGTWAKDITIIDGVHYVLNSEDKTAEVVKPDGDGAHYEGDIVVPDYLEHENVQYAVNAIGEGAFANAVLTSLQLPKATLKRIGLGAFTNTQGLSTIDIPETVTTIGQGVFECPDLTYLHIPASVTEMGNSAIGECPQLESVTVAESNPNIAIFDGVLMDKA